MTRSLISPSKYIQGNGVWKDFSTYVSPLGNDFLIIADSFILPQVEKEIGENLKQNNSSFIIEKFNGECSKKEIERLREVVKKNNSKIIIGVGGGKTLDTAKATSYYEKLPVVIVPTIASTDAPTSALAVIYTEDGIFDEYLFFPNNPNMVIVDSGVVAKAPARFLIAGMGDALATYFEARACVKSQATSMAGGNAPLASMALARLCYDTILANGFKAIQALEHKVATKAVEDVIEANIYLSGIGFESAGLAAAHAIHNGLTEIEEMHHLMHGEKVAFGTLAQLVLENAEIEEIEEVIDFCQTLGLPTTLEEMGVKEINNEDIMRVAVKSCEKGDTMHNMPFKVTPEDVYAAILATDALCKKYK
ncbi:MAG: glycerol dehydrogenase [Clostridium sp.]|uniref:glycerol dehydrogenase n=1 Tax=Clostridium sp. TaxID=1506 RepID=UPI00306B4A3E